MKRKWGENGMTQGEVKKSLLDQLQAQGKTSAYYTDLVNDYMEYYKQKKQLQQDIRKNGVRIKCKNGNGIETEKVNESFKLLQGVTKTMLDIIRDLNLREPQVDKSGGDADAYL